MQKGKKEKKKTAVEAGWWGWVMMGKDGCWTTVCQQLCNGLSHSDLINKECKSFKGGIARLAYTNM